MCHEEWPGVLFHLVYSVFVQKEGSITCFEVAFHPIKHVASRPRFGGDSQALSWSIPAEMRPSWTGTSYTGRDRYSTERVSLYLQVSGRFQADGNKQCFHNVYAYLFAARNSYG